MAEAIEMLFWGSRLTLSQETVFDGGIYSHLLDNKSAPSKTTDMWAVAAITIATCYCVVVILLCLVILPQFIILRVTQTNALASENHLYIEVRECCCVFVFWCCHMSVFVNNQNFEICWSWSVDFVNKETRSHPEMVGDMSRVTLNFDLSKIFLC